MGGRRHPVIAGDSQKVIENTGLMPRVEASLVGDRLESAVDYYTPSSFGGEGDKAYKVDTHHYNLWCVVMWDTRGSYRYYWCTLDAVGRVWEAVKASIVQDYASSETGVRVYYKSISELVAKFNSFFALGALKFFDGVVYPSIYGGRYFITSERLDKQSPRLFTVKEAKSSEIVTIGLFQQYATKAEAVASVYKLCEANGLNPHFGEA